MIDVATTCTAAPCSLLPYLNMRLLLQLVPTRDMVKLKSQFVLRRNSAGTKPKVEQVMASGEDGIPAEPS